MIGYILQWVLVFIAVALFIVYAIIEHNNDVTFPKHESILIYVVICLCVALFCGFIMHDIGEKKGAYKQMRGEYKVTYKTITITDGDNETQETDTIIHVFD